MTGEQTKKAGRCRRWTCRGLLGVFVVAVVLNWTWARLPDAPPPPAGSAYVEAGGQRIHYVETPGREPAVLMIHGLPGTWGDWDRVASQLRGQRTIRISRPGYAYSSEAYVPFDAQVTLLHDLAKLLKLDDPVIAGHSYGGSLALRYGQRYPDDVAGIVAVDPAVRSGGISGMRKAQARIVQASQLPVIEQVMDLTVSDLFRSVSARTGGTEAYAPNAREQAWLDRSLSLNMRDRDLTTWASETLDAPQALALVEDGLPKIRPRVRFIQGGDDALIETADVRAAAARVPNATLQVLPGGHMQTDVHPEQVAAAIRASAVAGGR